MDKTGIKKVRIRIILEYPQELIVGLGDNKVESTLYDNIHGAEGLFDLGVNDDPVAIDVDVSVD